MPDDVYDKYCRHGPRKDETTSWATIEIGKRFRHGRQQAGLTQRSVALRVGVSQSEISRFERGMTPHMSAYKVLEIGIALGPRFPFGYCPHNHQCVYARPSPEVELWDRLESRLGDDAAAGEAAAAGEDAVDGIGTVVGAR